MISVAIPSAEYELRQMYHRIILLLLSGVAVFEHGTAEAAFGQKGCCIVPDRAIVLYRDELYVLAPETRLILERRPEKRDAKIAGTLPESVQSVTNLGGGEYRKGGPTIAIITAFISEHQPINFYLIPTQVGRVALKQGKGQDYLFWQDKLKRSRRTVENADYEWNSFTLQCIAEGPHKNLFLTVSEEKVVIEDRQGQPLELWPLVLGEEKDAAEFQIIEFSGK
jgi:hypothetical protein